MRRRAAIAFLVVALLFLALVMVSAGKAEAADAYDEKYGQYTVGVDEIVVKTQYLPTSYHAYLKEAASFINKFTTSTVTVRRFCGNYKRCITVRESTSYGTDGTYNSAAVTTWMGVTTHRAEGSTWQWLGKEIRVHRDYRNIGRWRLRGLFAHELGHAVGHLKHDYLMENGEWNKPVSVMGNNGQGATRYWRIADASYDGQPTDQEILARY